MPVPALQRRRERLELMRRGGMIEEAVASLAAGGGQRRQIRLRQGFTCRGEVRSNPFHLRYGGDYVFDGPVTWHPEGRRTVPPADRKPPAARIVSPRGIAFRLYLITLCEAQLRQRSGEYARNMLPLMGLGTERGWTDLIVIPAKEVRARLIGERKKRYLLSALSRLAEPDARLIHLPQGDRRRGRFEGFEILDECGARAGGGSVAPYRIPRYNEANTFSVPLELFSNGWIHVLEDSELQFVLMLLTLQHRIPQHTPWIEVSESVRLSNFGFSRDGYRSHRTLKAFGLIDVQPGFGRAPDGTVTEGHHFDRLYHRFRLRLEGFADSASEVTFHAVDKLLRGGPEMDTMDGARLF